MALSCAAIRRDFVSLLRLPIIIIIIIIFFIIIIIIIIILQVVFHLSLSDTKYLQFYRTQLSILEKTTWHSYLKHNRSNIWGNGVSIIETS